MQSRLLTLHREKVLWMGLFLLAFLLRGLDVLLFQGKMVLEPGDQQDYERIAKEFALTGEFMPGSSYRPPLFPFVLGIYYRLVGFSPEGFFWLQALMGSLVVLMVAYGASRLLHFRAGMWAGLLCACDPVLIHYTTQLLTENLFLPLFVLAGLCLFLGGDSFKPIAGALWALAALCRPIIVALGLILVLIDIWRNKRDPRKIAITLLSVLAFSLVLAPWVVRNYRVHGAFVPLTTNTGVNLWMGNNENATGWYLPSDLGPRLPADEIQRDRIYLQEALRYIRENPLGASLLFLKKVILYWQPYPHPAPMMYLVLLGVLALWGILREWHLPLVRTLVALVLYFNLSTGVFFAAHRFVVPVLPLLTLLASLGVDNLLNPRQRTMRETTSSDA
ncbi:MAG: glycosyltransferase family 39 protein [Fimbriimonadales bacterium]|nr:glycosyltransferase family 39 protein [Fimbriimonadales bacterium]